MLVDILVRARASISWLRLQPRVFRGVVVLGWRLQSDGHGRRWLRRARQYGAPKKCENLESNARGTVCARLCEIWRDKKWMSRWSVRDKVCTERLNGSCCALTVVDQVQRRVLCDKKYIVHHYCSQNCFRFTQLPTKRIMNSHITHYHASIKWIVVFSSVQNIFTHHI